MKIEQYKKYIYAFLLLILIGGAFFASNRSMKQLPQDIGNDGVQNEQSQDSTKIIEDSSSDSTGDTDTQSYKELLASGQKFYLEERYPEALSVFIKAASLEQNAGIYRTIFSVYLKMKDYANAKQSIEKAISLSPAVSGNWIEYASFENYYIKSDFDSVSKIYLDALKATKDSIDVVTNYARYLEENGKYNDAIFYLEKAKTIDLKRKDIFQAEIDRLMKLTTQQ